MRFLGIALVYAYRYTLGPLFPTSCKYYPSCSEYAIGALRRYGFVRGSILTGWRLLRCNPWSNGGVDLPEQQRLFGQGRLRGLLRRGEEHA
jgi:putative membrane protein insertion efficiency factor